MSSTTIINEKQSVLLEKIEYAYQYSILILERQKQNEQLSPDEIMQEFVHEGNAAIRAYMVSATALDELQKDEIDRLKILSFYLYKKRFDEEKDKLVNIVDDVRRYLLLNELPFEPFEEEEGDDDNTYARQATKTVGTPTEN
jgi:hypothetical protein